MTEEPTNGDPPAVEPDRVWVTLDTLKDAAIDEVTEDSDLMLIVGDVDIEPKYSYKFLLANNTQDQILTKANDHKSVTYTRSRYMYCDHCEFKTKVKYSLIKHMERHYTRKPFHCNFCKFATPTKYTLKMHIKVQHKMFECTECPYKTIIKLNFKYHMIQHKKDKIQLEKYMRQQERERKRQEKNEELNPKLSKIEIQRERYLKVKNSYRCSKCPYVTLKQSTFVTHLRSKHRVLMGKEKKKQLKCEYCGFISKENHNVTLHTKRNLQDTLIRCKKCDFETWYMCEYKQHLKVHQNDDNEGLGLIKRKTERRNEKPKVKTEPELPETIDPDTYFHKTICVIDGVEYPRKPDLQRFVYNLSKRYIIDTGLTLNRKDIPIKKIFEDNNGLLFQCTQCVYEAKRKEFIRIHHEKHHTDSLAKPYLCLYCDFASKTRGHIRKHIKLNGRARTKRPGELHCKQCSFSSDIKCLFEMHERSHQPYKCTQCALRFKLDTQLIKHYEEMHLKSEYACELCDFTTIKKNKMLQHQNKHLGRFKREINCAL